MNIYISGIFGSGMAPLALLAAQTNHQVFGTDQNLDPELATLFSSHHIIYHQQDNLNFLNSTHQKHPIDWFIHTSALPSDHPELLLAQKLGLKISKRDQFINFLLSQLQLKLLAVAGTHGKTTTTSMIIWGAKTLNLPLSYLVGTTLPFAPPSQYLPSARHFVYEADEYDRNFLNFNPWTAVIGPVSYDHPDIYPTITDYQSAFTQFEHQSQNLIKIHQPHPSFTLAGVARRYDATLALKALQAISQDLNLSLTEAEIINALNQFPGAARRFERLKPDLYSDYAHHPEEITATINIAREQLQLDHKSGLTVVYQPHQNRRQHEIRADYKKAFLGADTIYWLPTYLTREDPKLPVLSPEELISGLENHQQCHTAKLDSNLKSKLQEALARNHLVLLLTAGPADRWFRQNLL